MDSKDEIREIERNIAECNMMIDHFIQLESIGVDYARGEIKYWRGMLQNAKLYKRSLLNA